MEKKMVQCQDGRQREARIHGDPKTEGQFKIWEAGIRLKGKHVNGEAWYSDKSKTWYFLTDPEGKHAHLMDDTINQVKHESVRQLQERLNILHTQYVTEQQKADEHHAAMKTIEKEMETLMANLNKAMAGTPLESGKPLEYSPLIKR